MSERDGQGEEATDGLEAQGGAQQADEELHARCARPGWEYETTTNGRKDGMDGRPPAGDGWERNTAKRDGWERFEYHEESYWRRPLKRTPRVWNTGDPEPKGVEKVRDRQGDVWTRWDQNWSITGPVGSAPWADLLTWAPLTEVLPEPAAPTAADLQAARDQTRADATEMLTVRAGEAQTITCSTCDGARVLPCAAHIAGDGCVDMLIDCPDCDPAADPVDPPYEAQDRTEGLDPAIEAALEAFQMTREEAVANVTRLVRAASPLIERAALQAAEDALGEEVDNANEPSDREALMHACDVVRRLRATRTETS